MSLKIILKIIVILTSVVGYVGLCLGQPLYHLFLFDYILVCAM